MEDGVRKSDSEEQKVDSVASEFHLSSVSPAIRRTPLIVGLAAWILLTEIGVEAWYRSHEARLPRATTWTVVWPADNSTFKELPISERTKQLLRYNEGRNASWQEGALTWQAFFFRWNPGRIATHLVLGRTPESCMVAAGHKLDLFEVGGLRLPFSVNRVADSARPFFVFYCLWDDRAGTQGFEVMGLSYGNRLAPVLAGQRNPGQRSIEIAVIGPETAAAAETAVRAELGKMIRSN